MPIIRIVRMKFVPENLEAFHRIFDNSKTTIRNFPGCRHLELHKDHRDDSVRYTYSIWDSEDDLNAYRKSEIFGEVWPKTKALFDAPPQAYSLSHLETVQ